MLRDTATVQANYQRFVERVATANEAWVLSDASGAASCESSDFEDADVILFFSDAAYARRARDQSFPEHEPKRLELFDLLYRWLPGMTQDGVIAGPNWTGDLVGLEVQALHLREELEQHLTPDQKNAFSERYHRATAGADDTASA